MIDLGAPMIPWEGLGGLKLYTHINDLSKYIDQAIKPPTLLRDSLVKYEIRDAVDLWFSVRNGKLFKLTALEKYTGQLFGKIGIGMHINDVLAIEPSFEYDDFEEVYCSPKGIYIETDPITDTVLWISVYVKEIDGEDFEEGNW